MMNEIHVEVMVIIAALEINITKHPAVPTRQVLAHADAFAVEICATLLLAGLASVALIGDAHEWLSAFVPAFLAYCLQPRLRGASSNRRFHTVRPFQEHPGLEVVGHPSTIVIMMIIVGVHINPIYWHFVQTFDGG